MSPTPCSQHITAPLRTIIGCAALLASTSMTALADDSGVSEPASVNEAFKALVDGGKILFDGRLRYSFADFDNLDLDANGLTYRIRAGFETGAVNNTKLLVEMEHTNAFSNQFNSTINGNITRPVVADPDSTELNRFQITNTSLPDTKITLGRQRIIHDDARFIGNVVWRQNEQTYDALRIENTSIPNLKLDLTYTDQVNRIFGSDSAGGQFDSESFFLHATYSVPTDVAAIKLKGFAYLLDFENEAIATTAQRLSTQTYGGTLTLAKGPFTLLGSYATQQDYGDSTLNYSADYYKVEASYSYAGAKLIGGYEVLGSDNGLGFVTPLSTAHKFQGFADLFLATPGAGVTDLYGGIDYTRKNWGPLGLFKLAGTVHTFDSDVGDQDYGDEVNLLLVTKFKALKNVKFLVKFADFYAADGFQQDRTRLTIEANVTF